MGLYQGSIPLSSGGEAHFGNVNEKINLHDISTEAHSDIRSELSNITIIAEAAQTSANNKTTMAEVNSAISTAISGIPAPDVSGQISIHNSSTSAHADIRSEIANHTHTAADIGAAPTNHNHTASEITSGTLPVTRGGTGVTSLSALKSAVTSDWELIQSYKTAGSYTFTVPSGVTKIGVYMVGGGGGGGGYGWYSSGNTNAYSVGGASGYGKNAEFTVTPGQTISVVVGSGGIGGVNGAGSGFTWRDPAAGGTTSFNGVTVSGGNPGGFAYISESTRTCPGADGGQGSCSGGSYPTHDILYGCVSTVCYIASQNGNTQCYVRVGGASQHPSEGQNKFDPDMVTLCAGGWASASLTTGQIIKAMPDGTKGGDGVRSTTTGITGNHATGNGNGGGGAMAVADNGRCYSTGGNGSDGMVLIYKKVV